MAKEKTLKELAEDKLKSGNASQLGDPVSLKAETSKTNPTKDEAGAKKTGNAGGKESLKQSVKEVQKISPSGSGGNSASKESGGKDGKHKTLSELAKGTNPTLLGDPISLKAEKSDSEPTEKDRGALKDGKKRASKI